MTTLDTLDLLLAMHRDLLEVVGVANAASPDLVVLWQEQVIDLLETQVRSLRVAEVDNRYERCQGDGENDVGRPADAVDEDWRDHHDAEVPHLGSR